MYMAPIVRNKPPVSSLARRATGAVAVPIAGAFLLPWVAGYALYAGLVLGLRGLLHAPRTIAQAVDYAGEVLLGH